MHPISQCLLHAALVEVGLDFKGERQNVDWDGVVAGVALLDCCEEALREEEGSNPVGQWCACGQPAIEEVDSFNKVADPGGDWLQGRIRDSCPVVRHLEPYEARVHFIQLT